MRRSTFLEQPLDDLEASTFISPEVHPHPCDRPCEVETPHFKPGRGLAFERMPRLRLDRTLERLAQGPVDLTLVATRVLVQDIGVFKKLSQYVSCLFLQNRRAR